MTWDMYFKEDRNLEVGYFDENTRCYQVKRFLWCAKVQRAKHSPTRRGLENDLVPYFSPDYELSPSVFDAKYDGFDCRSPVGDLSLRNQSRRYVSGCGYIDPGGVQLFLLIGRKFRSIYSLKFSHIITVTQVGGQKKELPAEVQMIATQSGGPSR